MADNTQTPDRSDSKMDREPGKNESMSQGGNNQTMQHEQAKASVTGENRGQSGQRELGSENREKSAIGGNDERSQTGEAGRARSELNENRDEKKQGEFSNQR